MIMHRPNLSSTFVIVVAGLLSPTVLGLMGSAKERCSKGATFAYNFLDCTTYYMCVHESPVLMPCPGDLVFSMRKESCVHRYDFTNDCPSSVTLPPPLVSYTSTPETRDTEVTESADISEMCTRDAERLIHPDMCHRYYDCHSTSNDTLNPLLQPVEHECPYPQLFDDDSKTCAPFTGVECGDRLEPTNPCDYSANHCNSAHCVPCQMYWASCQDLDDGLHPWEKGEGHVHWVDCRDGRNVGQGRCDSQNGVPYVFSQQSLSCVRYDETIIEQCLPTSQTFPHPGECHRYYDCGGYSHAPGDPAPALQAMLRTCDYPQLYSITAGGCLPFALVDCGARKEVFTPCDYRQDLKCSDPLYASCEGLEDGANVYRTREGSPHFVNCRHQRTVEKKICPIDDKGLFEQFSPELGKCVSLSQ